MYDYLKRSDIGAVKRVYENSEKDLEGYEPSVREKEKRQIPKQRLHMENGYGQVSFGMNSEGDTALVVSGKKDIGQNPVQEAGKKHDSKREAGKEAGVYENNTRQGMTALCYREKLENEKQKEKMLQGIRKTMETDQIIKGKENEIAGSQLPFLDVREDRELLKRLNEAENAGVYREHPGMEKEAGRKKEQLTQDIQRKEHLKRELFRGIEEALKAPVPKKDDLMWSIYRILSDAAETEDGSEEENSDKPRKKSK